MNSEEPQGLKPESFCSSNAALKAPLFHGVVGEGVVRDGVVRDRVVRNGVVPGGLVPDGVVCVGVVRAGVVRDRLVSRLAVLAGMGILAAGVLAQGMLAQNSVATKGPEAKPAEMAAAQDSDAGSDYVIGADDTLRISVWKEPDLTETLPVRPDGKISMPLLNDIPAAGLTPLQLKDSITDKLKKYIADPRVTVVVTAMNSRRIFVTGEVLHTGPMALLPHMTMLQALAQAGFTQFANLKAIYLLRTENGKQEKLPFNYKDVIKGNHPEQNIALKPGDTVVVP